MAAGAGAFSNGLGCGARFVKFFLVFCNFIFFVINCFTIDVLLIFSFSFSFRNHLIEMALTTYYF